MDALDLGLSLVIVTLAVGFLVSRFRTRKGPTCHPETEAPEVELGDGLARGLKRAQERRR